MQGQGCQSLELIPSGNPILLPPPQKRQKMDVGNIRSFPNEVGLMTKSVKWD